MSFEEKTLPDQVATLAHDFRLIQDTIATAQAYEKSMNKIGEQMDYLIKCTNRLYSDTDGFEGDIPEIKNHLKKVNGRLDKQGDVIYQHSMDIQTLNTARPYVEGQVAENRKYLFSMRHWIIMILVAVIGCGGGETLLDWIADEIGWW